MPFRDVLGSGSRRTSGSSIDFNIEPAVILSPASVDGALLASNEGTQPSFARGEPFTASDIQVASAISVRTANAILVGAIIASQRSRPSPGVCPSISVYVLLFARGHAALHARSRSIAVACAVAGNEPPRPRAIANCRAHIGKRSNRAPSSEDRAYSTLLGLDLDPFASNISWRTMRRCSRSLVACSSQGQISTRGTTRISWFGGRPMSLSAIHRMCRNHRRKMRSKRCWSGRYAHLMRPLEVARIARPRALALSWCSLSDPEKVLREAEKKVDTN